MENGVGSDGLPNKETAKEMIMHSALFAAIRPATRSTDWTIFIENVNKTKQIIDNADRLAEGVWLVNFHRSPAALGFLICFAENQAISYKILPLAAEPQWLPADPSPNIQRS